MSSLTVVVSLIKPCCRGLFRNPIPACRESRIFRSNFSLMMVMTYDMWDGSFSFFFSFVGLFDKSLLVWIRAWIATGAWRLLSNKTINKKKLSNIWRNLICRWWWTRRGRMNSWPLNEAWHVWVFATYRVQQWWQGCWFFWWANIFIYTTFFLTLGLLWYEFFT